MLTKGDEFVGFVCWKQNVEEKAVSISFISIKHAFRRMGLGKFIMQKLHVWAKKLKPKPRYIALSSLMSSVKFYHALGYKIDN